MTGWSYKRRRSHNAEKHVRYLIETEICKRLAVFMDLAVLYGTDLAVLYGTDRAMDIWERRNAEIQRRRNGE